LLALALAYGPPSIQLSAIIPLLLAILVVLATAWPRGDILIPYEQTSNEKNASFRPGQISRMAFSVRNAASGSAFSRSEISSILREGFENRLAFIKTQEAKSEALGHKEKERTSKELEELEPFGKDNDDIREKKGGFVSWLRGLIVMRDKNYLEKLEMVLEHIGADF
jgi:hypothetical protein